MTKREPSTTLTEKLSGATAAAERALPAKDSAILTSAILLPKTAKGLNLISGIFLKTFSADKEAEGQERKEARTSQ